jgi:hypothetical protein
MTIDLLIRNWALVMSSVLATAILLFVLFRLYQSSPRGRLAATAAELQKLQSEAKGAELRLERAEKRLASLRSKADTTKPKLLSEAEEAVQDAKSLQDITADQILRARKLLGDVIVEEFSPNRQDVLRDKYL